MCLYVIYAILANTFNSSKHTFWFENKSGIVELIESAGGDLLKEDLIKLYGKPKATAYRHINKAIKSGSIEEDDKHLILTE